VLRIEDLPTREATTESELSLGLFCSFCSVFSSSSFASSPVLRFNPAAEAEAEAEAAAGGLCILFLFQWNILDEKAAMRQQRI